MDTALAQGFGVALVIPAIASTIKQAQREAAPDLHILADYYRRGRDRAPELGAVPLSRSEAAAAERFGIVLVEQGINGTTFFLMVKVAAVTGGPLLGMIAQVGITANTVITPQQIQKFNPAQLLFDRIGKRPEWVSYMPIELVQHFAMASGRFANACGYGKTLRGSGGRKGHRLSFT